MPKAESHCDYTITLCVIV